MFSHLNDALIGRFASAHKRYCLLENVAVYVAKRQIDASDSVPEVVV